MSKVVYHPCNIPDFQGNPLIQALPPLMDTKDVARALIERPASGDQFRSMSQKERRKLTETVTRFYQPSTRDVELYDMIDRSLRWGYVSRNPLKPEYRVRFSGGKVLDEEGSYYIPYIPTTGGFLLMGITGLGKTSATRKILSLYPPLIRHQCFEGIHFQETQIVWLSMDCPSDGSLKGLCSKFFAEVDRLTGTTYYNQYSSSRTTLDTMMQAMTRIAASFHLGILVLDEIQNLCTSKSSENIPVKTLNFLITLINTICVPVVLIGTPRALPVFQAEMQQAKRATAQGAALWERMPEGPDWAMFVKALWPYQYTANAVELTDEMAHSLYEESIGIPFLAVQIYKLVQEKAIVSNTEIFTAEDFQVIAKSKMKLTQPMVQALKSGKSYNLSEYLDLTPFTPDDYRKLFPKQAPIPQPPTPDEKQSVQEKAIQTLLGLGLSYAEAKIYVNSYSAKHMDCDSEVIIARESYKAYLAKEAEKETDEKPQEPSFPVVEEGYDENLSKGVVGI